ncbi:hypothetical protein S7711_09353 [Stachybotrys chartarum IBT 7711]|uniref:Dehydrogenase FUB6 n=1 Tax=Stachybotrys chartarum (strain CBS 109288 / IBT 7711) TaxID=1280523 RepID=A0A084AYK0_STACB|nr:hypothetical protein S7711_09353 [Stachybotrys chartarum IBT 7711]
MPENRALVFKSVPTGLPVPGEHLVVEAAPYGPDAECPENGLLLQSLYSSIDPYQRARMRDAAEKGYSPPYTLGQPINNRGIAKVLRSNVAEYLEGDLVVGMMPVQEFVAVGEKLMFLIKPLQNPLGIQDIRVFLGGLGIPGLAAYAGLYEIGKPEPGQVIFISAASGAVGQMVGQFARREGLRTIGSVGSDEKLEYLTSKLGFDAGFNYKQESPGQALARLAPEGLDIYYDNVGGDHLEAALDNMKDFGRVIMCGTISEYNTAQRDRHPLRNSTLIFSKRLTVRGFIVSDKGIADKYGAEHQERVQGWIKEGTITTSTWETQGIENGPEALLALFSGSNFGKAVLKF